MRNKKFNYVMLTCLLANIATYPVIGLAENPNGDKQPTQTQASDNAISQVNSGNEGLFDSGSVKSAPPTSEETVETTSEAVTKTTDSSEKTRIQNLEVGIKYEAHVRNIGWQDWVADGQLSGNVGRDLPIEAYQIKLTGYLDKLYDVYYQVYAQNFGWLGWARNGQSAGTEGYAYHVEAIQVKLVSKGSSVPGKVGNAFRVKKTSNIISSVPYVSQYTPVFAPWGCAAVFYDHVTSFKRG